MPTARHSHAHTILKLPRTNLTSLSGGTVVALVGVVTLYLLDQEKNGNLAGLLPPDVLRALPVVLGLVMVIVGFLGTVGTPSLHPDVGLKTLHAGPIEHHAPPPDGGS